MFHSIKSSIHFVRITVIVKPHHHLRIGAVCYGCYSCTRRTHIKFASCCLDETLNSLPVSATYASRRVNDKSNVYNGLTFFICEIAKKKKEFSNILNLPLGLWPLLYYPKVYHFHFTDSNFFSILNYFVFIKRCPKLPSRSCLEIFSSFLR